MAFTYDLSTNIGQTRLQIADTTSTAYVFEDAEISYALTKGGSVDGATVALARMMLANAALRTKYFSLKGLSFDDRHRIDALKALIEQYAAESLTTVTVTSGSAMPFDDAFVEPFPTS